MQILRRRNADTTYSKPAKKWEQFHGMMIETLRHSVESSMLSSTVILLMGFFHTTMFQRFWVRVANAANGGESTPQKTLTEKEKPKQQQQEAEDSVECVFTDDRSTKLPPPPSPPLTPRVNQPDNPIVLTLDDDDSSLPIDSEIDPYSELEE